MDAGDVAVPSCDSCRNERAVVHCAQHGGARLCLLCDLAAHHAARAHQRAPLCDACHAAPAVARSDHHTEAFCASCACDGSRHCHRPAAAYTGIPGPAEMARIFSIDVPPPPPPTNEPWITDTLSFVPYDNTHIHMNYTNYYYPEVLKEANDANPDISKEMTTIGEEDLLVDNANQQDYFQAWTNSFDSVALMEPGALQEPSYLDLDTSYLDLGSYLDPDHQQMAFSSRSDIAMLSDTSFLQPLNMSNAPYVQLSMMDANINNDIGAASSSSDLAQLIPRSSDHSLLQPLNINDETAYDQLPVIDTNTSNNNTSSEFPCVNFQSSNTGSLLGGSSSMFDGQDQQASHVVLPEKSCPDPERRQRAVKRYKEKKNNRRFVKQIMYASRKATADTRRRVRGRFVKASLEQGTSSNDNKQPKHERN